ncbi:MAG: glycosyltransferase [Planctomycetes bacterium]|nr:glycosyltransferase [Planctomycetota bacterium]
MRERSDSERVHFHGAYERSNLSRHPATNVHAWLTASRARESFGLVLDEARALGLALVAPEHGAFAERGRAGDVAFFAPGDAASLANTLERLATEPGLAASLGARSRELGRAAESADAWCATLVEILEHAHERGAPQVPPEEWFAARMAQEFLDAWDRGARAGDPS